MRAKVRIFSGAVCEQYVFTISDRTKDVRSAEPPRPRFKDDEEREQYNRKKAERHFVRIVNSNFGPTSFYSTLTLDMEHEIHDFQTARKEFGNYINRLKRKYPAARIVWVMGRGKSTHRIHFHMISEGIPPEDIREKWGMGDVARVDPMREHNRNSDGVDCGQDYTSLAKYLFAHWTKEQGGHYWHGTKKTLRQPEREQTKEIKRNYTEKKPPRCPKGYILVETKATKYGYLYYKYVRKPAAKQRGGRKRGNTG